MNIETFRSYCLSFPGAEECFPFDKETLVFKVMGKMFALVGLEDPGKVNLKCEPEYAVELRDLHPEIIAGWHMSKKHWNTVLINGSLDDKFIESLVKHSYECVVAGLPKKLKSLLLH